MLAWDTRTAHARSLVNAARTLRVPTEWPRHAPKICTATQHVLLPIPSSLPSMARPSPRVRLRLTVIVPLLLSLLLFSSPVNAQKAPEVKRSYFQNLPGRVYYFDDASNMLYHDAIAGQLHVSADEGKTWRPAEGIPKGDATQLVEHPFDNMVVRSLLPLH
jgi:hypothetical protein